ncbi:hypothetical protein HETIRDRAFT_445949 [Heterobasidion irregulare TC 32-1]|uniref:Uncharacterized protein n=1 Tax=Heterobasidion irregulare (strain TC 32-1) TaxID=747525 RepID=W4K204_HETIT|nr:uncharacterized protein HETIRDRAFT_445949 [Heterobasidion irregulare TC 32-1]ETW79370.1 hypothetical protein HETIRDRAFT_445949 [Heterobasidion irregulare TC 32-1]
MASQTRPRYRGVLARRRPTSPAAPTLTFARGARPRASPITARVPLKIDEAPGDTAEPVRTARVRNRGGSGKGKAVRGRAREDKDDSESRRRRSEAPSRGFRDHACPVCPRRMFASLVCALRVRSACYGWRAVSRPALFDVHCRSHHPRARPCPSSSSSSSPSFSPSLLRIIDHIIDPATTPQVSSAHPPARTPADIPAGPTFPFTLARTLIQERHATTHVHIRPFCPSTKGAKIAMGNDAAAAGKTLDRIADKRASGRAREVDGGRELTITAQERAIYDAEETGQSTETDGEGKNESGKCGTVKRVVPPARRAGQQKVTTWSVREKRRKGRGETRSTACSAAWQEAADVKKMNQQADQKKKQAGHAASERVRNLIPSSVAGGGRRKQICEVLKKEKKRAKVPKRSRLKRG